MNIKKTLIIILSCTLLQVHAQTSLSIIPAPVKTQIKDGSFAITRQTVIIAGTDKEQATIHFFNTYLQQYYGFSLSTAKEASTNFIKLTTPAAMQTPDRPEGYTLLITPSGVQIKGNSHSGTFYGIQTLIQLLPVQKTTTLKIPAVFIEDYPRFGYRGAMLDVCRHFFDTDLIKKWIDLLALHKMNTFHWHLTDDQGWRIAIKNIPV